MGLTSLLRVRNTDSAQRQAVEDLRTKKPETREETTVPKKRHRLRYAFGGIFLFIALLFCIHVITGSSDLSMTFEVTVPANTPADDLVYLAIGGGYNEHRMTKTGNNLWSIKLSQGDLSPDDEGIIPYRYVRDGYGFNTAEYLSPDKQGTFRKAQFKPGGAQKDSIGRWRWFPAGNVSVTPSTNLTPGTIFVPRLGGQQFLSGQVIEDFYSPYFKPLFASTAAHMQSVGYNYVAFDPPEQWAEVNGLPVVQNQIKTSPNYPDGATLKAEIKEYTDRGFTVLMSPQVCCTELSTENRSAEWWDAYYSETQKFLVRFATIAQQAGVQYFQYYIDHQGPDISTHNKQIFAAIRQVYKGKVGEGVWSFGTEARTIPLASEITWGDDLDYFYVDALYPLSTQPNPTDAELKAGADRMLDATKTLYDKFKKPVIIQTAYFNVQQSWRGNDFYNIEDPPWTNQPESATQSGKYIFNQSDLAHTVNAYFNSMATRPWIIGYAQFNYTHWINPLATELSVRGTESEALWQKWNNAIFK